MDPIGREAFIRNGGNPMAHAAADEIHYFHGSEALGVVADYEDKDRTVASVLRPSPYFDGQYRVDKSDRFAGSDSREDAKDWLDGQE